MSNSEPLWPQALPQQCQSPWSHQGCGTSSVPPYAWDQGLPSPKAAEMGIIQQVPLDAWSQPLSPLEKPCPEPKQPWCSPKDLVLSLSSLLLVPHHHQNSCGWTCPESPWGPRIPISQSQMFPAALPAGCAIPRAAW